MKTCAQKSIITLKNFRALRWHRRLACVFLWLQPGFPFQKLTGETPVPLRSAKSWKHFFLQLAVKTIIDRTENGFLRRVQ